MLALSFIFLKAGLQTKVDLLWATFVRLAAGTIGLWSIGTMRGCATAAIQSAIRNPRINWLLFIACACGAVGMLWAVLAMDRVPAGVAATLIGLQPIMVTLIGAIWYRRRPSARIVAGIVVAFCGTALICLR